MHQEQTALVQSLSMRSPCDNCHCYFECADQKLACSDFLHFVHSGDITQKSREPSKKFFRMIFKSAE